WPYGVDRARSRLSNPALQRRAAVAVAAHARAARVDELGRDAVERFIVLGRKARPVRRIGAAGAAGLAGIFSRLQSSSVRRVRCPFRHPLWASSLGIFRPFPDHALPPPRAQDIAPLRVFVVEIIGIYDAISAKAAKILAQLAPGREQPHRFEIADRDRPDRALGGPALLVAVMQRDLLAFVNMRACLHHVDAVGFAGPWRAGAARGLD